MAITIPHEALVEVQTSPPYPVVFTRLAEISTLLADLGQEVHKSVVITDTNVAALYGDAVRKCLNSSGTSSLSVVLPAGESTKQLNQLEEIYDLALDWGIDRHTLVVALGGGVIGDIAGFAAATLLRGLPVVQVPTTLIAQVDSAIGGKTGINHRQGKNLIGAFHQPLAVVADIETLRTLPEREWMSGLAEVVKHALIDDEPLVAFLEMNWERVIARERSTLAELLTRAVAVKARVVAEDVRESGRRVILNFGHTFAHAIEKESGYGTFTHGEAVAAGMRAAIEVSRELHPEFDWDRANRLVSRLPVPRGLSRLAVPRLIDSMQVDKKVRFGHVRYVLLRRIGEAYATSDVDPEIIESVWRRLQASVG